MADEQNECTVLQSELVRLIAQALYALDLPFPAAFLEVEYGISVESKLAKSFRIQILKGRWDQSLATLRKLLPGTPYSLPAFFILQQKFFECIAQQDWLGAITTLRSEIVHLDVDFDSVRELSLCLALPSRRHHMSVVKPGPVSSSRLLKVLEGYLCKYSILIPERRLETILEQFLVLQLPSRNYHCVDGPISLLSNHRCGPECIPRHTVQILTAHKSRVWFVEFSHDGRHLASCSSDCTAIIWEVYIWNQTTGELLAVLSGHSGPVTCVSWNPVDPFMFASASDDGTIRIWGREFEEIIT